MNFCIGICIYYNIIARIAGKVNSFHKKNPSWPTKSVCRTRSPPQKNCPIHETCTGNKNHKKTVFSRTRRRSVCIRSSTANLWNDRLQTRHIVVTENKQCAHRLISFPMVFDGGIIAQLSDSVKSRMYVFRKTLDSRRISWYNKDKKAPVTVLPPNLVMK